jgi:hypothetical protein
MLVTLGLFFYQKTQFEKLGILVLFAYLAHTITQESFL